MRATNVFAVALQQFTLHILAAAEGIVGHDPKRNNFKSKERRKKQWYER